MCQRVVMMIRPPGVQQRVKELLDSEWSYVHSFPGRGLRVHLTSFISLCGRLWYDDHPVTTVLRRYHEVGVYLDDLSQERVHTDFENKSIICVEQLRPEIGELANKPIEDISLDAQEEAREPLLRIPSTVFFGKADRESYFHLVCWNEANSLVEGMQTPYRAARQIANMGFHNPADPYDLIKPLTNLAVRYEDYPDERGETGAAIVAVLAGYITRAPW